ncbi:YchJ family protein [Austwickia chelonae]|uniref:YchJ family protein n=1 Tax=Austwickia chelonae TaxID=100225 RepID=UPI003D31601B
MRSRYSAFALGDERYLLRTWHPRTRPEALRLDPGHRWVSLEVLGTHEGQDADETGVVTYRARSRGHNGEESTMTEISRFERRAGRWVYVDGEIVD